MIKITRNLLESLGWKKDDFFEDNNIYVYKSPDGRCELTHGKDSNLSDEDGYGWMILIDNSRHESLACCDVEYMEQIDALIEIYKDY